VPLSNSSKASHSIRDLLGKCCLIVLINDIGGPNSSASGKDSGGKENDNATLQSALRAEQFAVSLRKDKKRELLGAKRMRHLNAQIQQENKNSALKEEETKQLAENLRRLSSSGIDRSIAYK
jgi:hypothetical protein